MAKEAKQRKDERKKPTMTLKERRQKKHEKKEHKSEHRFDIGTPEEGV
jgi:hypothetical protein